MRVTPASRAAWMVRIERSSSGRPSMDIGMPPRPIALTVLDPMVRCCNGASLVRSFGRSVVSRRPAAAGRVTPRHGPYPGFGDRHPQPEPSEAVGGVRLGELDAP